jgi:hypothetical protein
MSEAPPLGQTSSPRLFFTFAVRMWVETRFPVQTFFLSFLSHHNFWLRIGLICLLGELTRKDEADGGLDLAGRERGLGLAGNRLPRKESGEGEKVWTRRGRRGKGKIENCLNGEGCSLVDVRYPFLSSFFIFSLCTAR